MHGLAARRIDSLRKRGSGSRRSGQAMVELALLLPVLMLLLAGAVDMGGLYSQVGVIASAVRQGARYGATNPTDTDTIKSRTIEEASGSDVTLTTSNITVSTPSGTGSGNPITVTVNYSYRTLFGSVLHMQTISVTRQCTMRIF